jgi:putative transposase
VLLRYSVVHTVPALCRQTALSRRVHGEHVYPYLLRGLTCRYPNHIWGIDVISIPLQRSRRYLVAVLDWRSRYVVSWERDDML